MIARKSFTFVPVGPVTNKSPLFLKAKYELFSNKSTSGLNFLFLIFNNVFSSIIAPALFSVPSIPSVSAAIAKKAHKNGTTLKQEVLKAGLIKEKEYNKIMSPIQMTKPK